MYDPAALLFCREVLHQQEQRTAQLRQLLQKDALIKLAFLAHIMGRCTYRQVRPVWCAQRTRSSSSSIVGFRDVSYFGICRAMSYCMYLVMLRFISS